MSISPFFFRGDDGRTCVDDFTAVNNDHFEKGNIYYIIYYIIIIINGLVYELHVCDTYLVF